MNTSFLKQEESEYIMYACVYVYVRHVYTNMHGTQTMMICNTIYRKITETSDGGGGEINTTID